MTTPPALFSVTAVRVLAPDVSEIIPLVPLGANANVPVHEIVPANNTTRVELAAPTTLIVLEPDRVPT